MEIPQLKVSQGSIYLVGGSVRDKIMNRKMHDWDFVLVGATEESAKKDFEGWEYVGTSFPVFRKVIGQDKELNNVIVDIALARKERKVSEGHKGFEVDFSSSVTLEEDLSRRDLTINSIAMDFNGNITDPFNGVDDISKKILRHTSNAFSEDPLRVYRLARFASQLGFGIAQKTVNFAKKLEKELLTLSRDRVREEFTKACAGNYPWRFLETLTICECLDVHFNSLSCDISILKELKLNNVDPSFIATEMLKASNSDELAKFDKLIGITSEVNVALKIFKTIQLIAQSRGILGPINREVAGWVNLLRACRRGNVNISMIESIVKCYLGYRGLFIFAEGRKILERTKASSFPGIAGAELGQAIDKHIFMEVRNVCMSEIPQCF